MEVSPGSGQEERGESNTPMTCWSPWTLNLPPVFIQQALSASCVRDRGTPFQPLTIAQVAARARPLLPAHRTGPP